MMVHGRARHFCSGLGHHIAEIIVFFDVLVVEFAEVVPDCSFAWNNVRLISTVDDHAMRTLRRAKMLATKIPTGIHQFDGVQRTAPFPWSSSGVCGLAVKEILDGYKPAPLSVTHRVRGIKLIPDV